MNGTPNTPTYARLADRALCARLITIREAVTPILATNNLPYFTDHSAAHSAALCSIVDELTTPLEKIGQQLNDTEAFVLYAACYLHDVGMQHQKAGETEVIRRVLSKAPYKGQRWDDLEIETRRTLLRDHHHCVSNEMVRSSMNVANPILGVQLDQSDQPGAIGCLCESHGLPPHTDCYRALLEEGPNLRMTLLAALLRLADILDESRRRAKLYLQRTRDLDITSQMHWWRHHYVKEITFNPREQTITVWFDFPADKRLEYNKLVPELQLPFLEEELSYHRSVLVKAELHWTIRQRETPRASTDAEPMPDAVQMRMVDELRRKRSYELQVERHAVLSHLQQDRNLVQRGFDALRDEDPRLSADDHLRRAAELARQLWGIGGRRDAWRMLSGEHDKMKSQASPAVLVETGNTLCRMLLDDNISERAIHSLQDLQVLVDKLDEHDPLRLDWLRLMAEAFVEQCAYQQAVERISELVRVLPDEVERDSWKARLAEIHMLQGNFAAAESLVQQKEELR